MGTSFNKLAWPGWMTLSPALTPAERTFAGTGSISGLLSSSSGHRSRDPLEPHRLPASGLQGGKRDRVLASFTGVENSCLQHVERIVVMPDAGFYKRHPAGRAMSLYLNPFCYLGFRGHEEFRGSKAGQMTGG